MKIQIESDLFLSQLSPEDAPELFSLVDTNRKYLREWLPWLDSNTELTDTQSFIQFTLDSFQDNQNVTFGIRHHDELVGIVGQHQVNWSNHYTEIGYWLSEEKSGRGIMSKSVTALLDYSFNTLELNMVSLAAATENYDSRNVAKRLGFKLDGILRQKECLYGKFVDHAVYSLLKSEFKK